jgi:hypothetical protein
MRPIIFAIILLFTGILSNAQDNDALNRRERELIITRQKLVDSISRIDSEIELIKKSKIFNEYRQSAQSLSKRYFSSLTATSPYITAEPIGGEKTSLTRGDLVELIDLADAKIKVFVGQKIGYVWIEDLMPNQDVREFVQLMKNKAIYNSVKAKRESELDGIRLDSLKKAMRDSAIFIVKSNKALGERTLYTNRTDFVPKGYIAPGEILKIDEIVRDDTMWKVTAINKHLTGYISRYELDCDPALIAHVNTLNASRANSGATRFQSGNTSNNAGNSVQCSGTTQKGARCRRMTTSSSGRCYQH